LVTVGDVLRQIDVGCHDLAWLRLDAELRSIAALDGRHADAASEVLVRSMRDGCAALRRARSESPLRAWLANTLRYVKLEEARRRSRDGRVELSSGLRCLRANPQPTSIPGWGDLDLSKLTVAQRTAWELRMAGATQLEIARELGISRVAVRERLARAVQRLSDRVEGAVQDRTWVAEMLQRNGVPRTIISPQETHELLRAYAAGRPIDEIACELDVSVGALRKRIQRLRARWLVARSATK